MSKITKYKKTGIVLGVLLFAMTLIGAGSADAYTFTQYMRYGSRGPEVVELQKVLNAGGYAVPPLVVDGIFGQKTRAAVITFQASKGLARDGIVGPITRAALNAGVVVVVPPVVVAPGCLPGYAFNPMTGAPCTTTTPPPSNNNGGLQGGAGDITLSLRGTYSGEEVGEGEEDEEILQVDVEADDGSDVELNSVRVEFFQSSTADDRDLKDYASEVSVWLDGDKVGSADTDDFSESNTNYFSKSINLEDAIIRAGEEGELVIAITANNSLDSGDIDSDAWQVDLLSVRFTDADGVTTTESGSAAATAGAGAYGKLFDFASFATANDAELRVSLGDADINDVRVLDVDDSNNTDQEILSFTLDASGDSDVVVDEIPVVITTTGETDESVIVASAQLFVEGAAISGKEDVPAGGAVTFDDLDYTVEAGEEVEVVLVVELQETDGALDDADTIQATVTVGSIVAEDESGETLTATGSAAGGAHVVFQNGIELTGFTQSAQSFTVDGANNDRVELTLNFDVHNFGDSTLYIPNVDTLTGTSTSATTTAPTTSQGVGYHIQSAGSVTPGSNDISAILTESDPDLTLGTNAFELKAGKTGTLTLKVTVATDGNPSIDNVAFRALLTGVNWATSDSATGSQVYTYNLGDYKTDYATIAD